MRRYVTQGIVLSRTDYGEADRILTFLTAERGKIKALAKGVRKSKSKLAGGIELFSVSDLTLILGRGEINTLISSRLARHYGNIVKDLERTKAAYEMMRAVNRATEDGPERTYFELLDKALAALDDQKIPLALNILWLKMQLLKLAGHTPNLRTDIEGKKLEELKKYNLDIDKMALSKDSRGRFHASHIKFLRLGFTNHGPKTLNRIKDVSKLIKTVEPAVELMFKTFVRI